jgi:hypothetical protein
MQSDAPDFQSGEFAGPAREASDLELEADQEGLSSITFGRWEQDRRLLTGSIQPREHRNREAVFATASHWYEA